MNCPKCQIPMREREKDDLVIDVCPQCRGVWLDAGELEKLSVREGGYYGDRDRDDDDDDDRRRREPGAYDRDRRSDDDRGYRQQPKKKSFLSTIFESMGEGRD